MDMHSNLVQGATASLHHDLPLHGVQSHGERINVVTTTPEQDLSMANFFLPFAFYVKQFTS
jgi:hypothetical protein